MEANLLETGQTGAGIDLGQTQQRLEDGDYPVEVGGVVVPESEGYDDAGRTQSASRLDASSPCCTAQSRPSQPAIRAS